MVEAEQFVPGDSVAMSSCLIDVLCIRLVSGQLTPQLGYRPRISCV